MNRQDPKDAKDLCSTFVRDEPPAHLDELARRVIGAAIEVHRELGPGFLESTYERALRIELSLQQIPFGTQHVVSTYYKGQPIADHRFDLLVAGELVVEIKAVESLAAIHTAQVLSYLKAGGYQLGLLINFNVPLLKNGVRRLIWS